MTNHLVIRRPPNASLASAAKTSGYFSGLRNEAQAQIKIAAGQAIGIDPVSSLANIYLVKGKISLSAQLQAALTKRSDRYNYCVIETTDTVCRLQFQENGQDVGEASFTIEEAKRAGLANKDNWRHYPSDMLFARALTRGIRRYCPDVVIGGAYTPEELGEPTNQEQPIIDVKLEPARDGHISAPGQATLEQLRAIRQAKEELQIDADAWKQILGKRGVASARDLPEDQAADLLKRLEHRLACKDLENSLQEQPRLTTDVDLSNAKTKGGEPEPTGLQVLGYPPTWITETKELILLRKALTGAIEDGNHL
jgi:hypothetical protein